MENYQCSSNLSKQIGEEILYCGHGTEDKSGPVKNKETWLHTGDMTLCKAM